MKKIIICAVILLAIISFSFSQVYTDFEAKQKLREWGVFSTNIIQDAELIVASRGGKIIGIGGLCIDLPILDFISQDQVILITGVDGVVTKKGSIIIEATSLFASAVVFAGGGKKYLIAGPSLKDIVNYLIKQRESIEDEPSLLSASDR